MCYDINAKKSAWEKEAKRYSLDEEAVQQALSLSGLPLYHASGFSHPVLPILINRDSITATIATWGLLPHWAKDKTMWNKTLNARSETMFEKPAYRGFTKNRCVLFVNGFYEHHHQNKTTYPFFIHLANDKPMAFAGLYSNWTDKTTGEVLTTFTIITCMANALLAKLHNNPKLTFGARMPAILTDNQIEMWLNPNLAKQDIQALITSYPADAMQYCTVGRLRGKSYIGNKPEIEQPFDYPELNFNV